MALRSLQAIIAYKSSTTDYTEQYSESGIAAEVLHN